MLHRFPERINGLIDKIRSDPKPQVRGEGLLVLARLVRESADRDYRQLLENWLNREIERADAGADPESVIFWQLKRFEVSGIARLTAVYPELLNVLVGGKEVPSFRAAIAAAGATQDLRFLGPLLELLPQKKYKREVRKALARFEVVGILEIEHKIEAAELRLPILRELPRLFAVLRDSAAHAALLRLIDHPRLIVSLEALRMLNDRKIADPKLKFPHKEINSRLRHATRRWRETLGIYYRQQLELRVITADSEAADPSVRAARSGLVRLLERRLDGHLERVVRLLALRYTATDIIPIYRELLRGNAIRRASALEFLDNLLDRKLRRELLPLLEITLLLRHAPTLIEQFPFALPADPDALARLLAGNDRRLKLAALYLIEQLQDPRFQVLVIPYRDDPDERVRDFTQRIA
jgi:AAA family ATP:ADP antiporter